MLSFVFQHHSGRLTTAFIRPDVYLMKALRHAMTLQTANTCHWTYRSRRTERARKTFTKFSDEI